VTIPRRFSDERRRYFPIPRELTLRVRAVSLPAAEAEST
jgi:hypothetical protein